MSDSQKFGGGPSVDVADPQPIPTEIDAPPRKLTAKTVVLGAVIVLILANAAYFLLFNSPTVETSGSSGLVTPGAKTSTAPAKPAASKAPTTAPAVAGNGLSSGGRDPFAPLVVAANPSASTSTSATTSAGTGGTTTPAGIKSTLLVNSVSVAGNSASVTVDGKPYIAYAGQLFAKYYTLKVVVSGSAQCAVFDFGDLPAQICKGQQATFTG
jgi:hypothetical protein